MLATRCYSTFRLVNGSTGDPVLYIDSPGRDNAFLFDAGDNSRLSMTELADLDAVFISHHHVDHFIGLDRIVRANLDRDKTLQIFGPEKTIQKVYDRIKSYGIQFFPFKKMGCGVNEILPNCFSRVLLECPRQFPKPVIEEVPRDGLLIYEPRDAFVEAVHVEHTVSCLAYALVEKPGWQIDCVKLTAQGLSTGPWISEALTKIQSRVSLNTKFQIPDHEPRTLGKILRECFSQSYGSRVAFVTDTVWNESVRDALLPITQGAWRLYCDCFYAREQAAQAATHRHMTTVHAAELARLAAVDELILIHFATRYVDNYSKLLDQVRPHFPNVTAEFSN